MCSWMAASSSPEARNWLWNSKEKGTAGSKRRGRGPARGDPERSVSRMIDDHTGKRLLHRRAGSSWTGASAGRNYPWLSAIRRQAAERFAEIGFPTTEDEAWRHTNVAPIASASFEPALPGSQRRHRRDARQLPVRRYRLLQPGFCERLLFVEPFHPGSPAQGRQGQQPGGGTAVGTEEDRALSCPARRLSGRMHSSP